MATTVVSEVQKTELQAVRRTCGKTRTSAGGGVCMQAYLIGIGFLPSINAPTRAATNGIMSGG